MSGFIRPIRNRRRCGRWHAMAKCWETSSLCWRNSSSRASWCNSATSTISRQPVAINSAEFCACLSRLQLVSVSDGVKTGKQQLSIERPIAW